jgi:hypothetical protein
MDMPQTNSNRGALFSMQPPLISITSDEAPETPKEVRKMYRIPSSKRLNSILVNQRHRDITATVGSYNPYPPLPKKNFKEWPITKRFTEDQEITMTGPGYYDPLPPKMKIVQSPFVSATRRFVEKESTSIAPGTYNLDEKPVSSVWKPWVVHVSSRLGRLIEKQESKTVVGSESQILMRLTSSSPKSEFLDTKNRIQNKGETPKENVKPKKLGFESKSSTTNPYSASFFVTSVPVPPHLPPLP